jgi:chloramphenicol O-acetyltransferase
VDINYFCKCKCNHIMNTIQIPLDEYQFMQEELILLRNTELLAKMNRLIDLLFQEKYGLFMQDYTEDLTEYSMNNAWRKEDTNAWDNL